MKKRDLIRTVRGFFNVRAGRASYEAIHKRIVAGVRVDGIHVCQLIAAMIIASIGLNVDSTEAIVGAMLICPLMGTVLAISYAVATVDGRLFRRASMALFVEFLVCLLTSSFYFLISPLSGTTSSLLTNASPTIWDVILALVGGFAGALGMSRQQEPGTLIAGVAVATSLMPPLCATGYGVAAHDVVLAGSALYEFLVNVVFIAFGAEMVLVLLKVPIMGDLNGDGVVTPEEEKLAKERSRSMRLRVLAGTLICIIPCLFFSAKLVQSQVDETGSVFETQDTYDAELTTQELAIVCPAVTDYRIGMVDSYDEKNDLLLQRVVATVETSEPLDEKDRQNIEDLIRLHVDDLDEVTFEVTDDAKAADGATAADDAKAVDDAKES